MNGPLARRSRPGGGLQDVSHVIFDFDGTISWLRSSWPDLMTQIFWEQIEGEPCKLAWCREDIRRGILSLNGRPSIYQVEWFVEAAKRKGASVPGSHVLLNHYLDRLRETVSSRVNSIRSGEMAAGDFLIAGIVELLGRLQQKGLKLIILSGTAEVEVRRESELLGVNHFFGENIFGSTPGIPFSKKDVIDRVIDREGISGENILSFGDGPVEIQFTKDVGGLAVGVASDERINGSGKVDEDKREHLVRAGADLIVPDYRNVRQIFDTFFV